MLSTDDSLFFAVPNLESLHDESSLNDFLLRVSCPKRWFPDLILTMAVYEPPSIFDDRVRLKFLLLLNRRSDLSVFLQEILF